MNVNKIDIQFPKGLEVLLNKEHGEQAKATFISLFTEHNVDELRLITKHEFDFGGSTNIYYLADGHPYKGRMENHDQIFLQLTPWFDELWHLFLPSEIIFDGFTSNGDAYLQLHLKLQNSGRIDYTLTSKFGDCLF
jgi:hypothetical protein